MYTGNYLTAQQYFKTHYEKFKNLLDHYQEELRFEEYSWRAKIFTWFGDVLTPLYKRNPGNFKEYFVFPGYYYMNAANLLDSRRKEFHGRNEMGNLE